MELLTPVRHPKVQAAERLEVEISELAGHLAAATCRFLLLIAEFDRLDGWVGHRSCAQWLSWRCGLSASTAREHVRVAHALEEYPVIQEAFATGRLSYSKVRAITRVAHPGNEAELVETALVTTAAQLDRIVQAMRTATRQQVGERHRRRALSWRWDDDGMLVLSVRLDPDEGAVALAALRAAQSPDPHLANDGLVEDEPPSCRAGSHHASATSDAACGQSAPRATSAPAEAQSAASSTRAPAEAPGGCSEPEGSGITLADAFGAIMTSYLGSAARDAADSEAFQVVVLTDAITPAENGDTAETGSTAEAGAAAEAGHAAEPGSAAKAGDAGKSTAPGTTETVFAGRADAAPVAARGVEDGRPGGLTDSGIAFPRDTVLRIACTAAVVHALVSADGTPMDVGRKTRRINASLRRALRLRDAARCRFPGCAARRRLHAHHVRHWADGGETTLANLISLCPAHHWAVHEGGHLIWIDETGRLRFAGPDGRILEPTPATGPATGDLVTTNEGITPDVIGPHWDGTPLDLDNAVLALLQPAFGEVRRAGRPAA